MKPKKNDKKLNPFEVHINNKKFTILGRKSKNEVGKPGIARSKSIQKRKKSLLIEYKLKDKSNKFVDRRIGEKNRAMTAEDRIIARFTASRVKDQKKMKYNLGEEEDLTHQGQTLSTIEKFEKPASDDDNDSDDERTGGKLAAEFVEKAHFGGGVLSRAGDGESSHRDLIDKLIAESKLRKYEKKKLKQESNELTEQLDKDWIELMPIVPTKKRGEMDDEDEPPLKKKVDKNSYDVLMRSLKFERRGMASDKLKSEEEIAKKETERLEKFESERLRRMKGIPDDEIIKHKSADDLDDGFDFGDDEIQPLAYDSKGKPLNCGNLVAVNEDNDANYEENEMNSEFEVDEENESNDEMDSDDENESNDKMGSDEENESNDEMGSDEELEDDIENNLDNDMSDLKEENEFSGNEATKQVIKKKSKIFTQLLKENKSLIMDKNDKFQPKERRNDHGVPECYEHFDITIIDERDKHILGIMDNNRDIDLHRFFILLLHTMNNKSHSTEGWVLLDYLSPHLYTLTTRYPQYAAKCLIGILKEKHTDFVQSTSKQITSDMLIFLKLVPLLFPPSDYHHPVCTCAVMIATEILSLTRIKNRSDITSCLLLTTILLDYIQLSHRYIPETVNILRGILLMATENSSVSYVQQFRPNIKMLIVQNNEIPTEWPTKLNIREIFSVKDIDNTFKMTSLYVTLDLVCRFCNLWKHIPSVGEIWIPHLSIINSLQIESDKMNEQIDKTKIQLQIIKDKKLEKLQTLSNKPKALRLYEARFQKIYDGRTFKMQSKEKSDMSKLQHRVKREMKSAVREIRKDNSFISKLKYHEQTKSDMERRQKVKQIYSWGANQAQEINKMAKKNKK